MTLLDDYGYAAFLAVHRQTFRIEARFAGKYVPGTAFCISRLEKSNRLILATAGHVISQLPEDTIKWVLWQFDENGSVERKMEFTTRPTDPERIYIYHKSIDIGFIVLPSEDDAGKTIALPNEMPLPPIDDTRRITEGTRVGWAGFPCVLGDLMGEQRLCYFEGVVSAFYSQLDEPMYIVDGHSAHGVSGGPMWNWPADHKNIEIFAIVTGYGMADEGLPGFCMSVPLNPLIRRLREMYNVISVRPS